MSFRFTPGCCCNKCEKCKIELFYATRWWVGARNAERMIKQIRDQDCRYGYIAILSRKRLPVCTCFTYTKKSTGSVYTDEEAFTAHSLNDSYVISGYNEAFAYSYLTYPDGSTLDLTRFTGGRMKTTEIDGVEHIECTDRPNGISRLYDYMDEWCAAQWMRCVHIESASRGSELSRYLIEERSAPRRITYNGTHVVIPNEDFYISRIQFVGSSGMYANFDSFDSFGHKSNGRVYRLTSQQFIEEYLAGNLAEATGDPVFRGAKSLSVYFSGTLKCTVELNLSNENTDFTHTYSTCGHVILKTVDVDAYGEIDSIDGYVWIMPKGQNRVLSVPYSEHTCVIPLNIEYEVLNSVTMAGGCDSAVSYDDVVAIYRDRFVDNLVQKALSNVVILPYGKTRLLSPYVE